MVMANQFKESCTRSMSREVNLQSIQMAGVDIASHFRKEQVKWSRTFTKVVTTSSGVKSKTEIIESEKLEVASSFC